MLLKSYNIKKFLLIGFVFTLPNSIALNNMFLVFIIIYWIFFEDKKDFFKFVKYTPIAIISVLYFFSFIFSLIYTSDFYNAVEILKREIKFLFLPIFIYLLKDENSSLYLKTFVISMMIDEILSYLIFLNILPPMFRATSNDPAVFMTHIAYNPFLALTIFILIFEIFKEKLRGLELFISLLFLTTMIINMFITGGRAGYVAFLLILIIASFLLFKHKKYIFLSLIGIFIIFVSAYKLSPIFKYRVNLAIHNIKNFNKNPNTSIGKRIVFWKNTILIIKNNFLLGVGCGDFKKEYEKLNKKYTPNLPVASQPHNMYLFVWAVNGILGILILLFFFAMLIYCAIKIDDFYKELRIIFVILFIIINFSDSYLLNHYTTSLFIFFTALLFKECKWDKYQLV